MICFHIFSNEFNGYYIKSIDKETSYSYIFIELIFKRIPVFTNYEFGFQNQINKTFAYSWKLNIESMHDFYFDQSITIKDLRKILS